MASVNGENLAPFGPGHGGAVVLGTDLTPLRLLQRGDAVRAAAAAREAALRQKQALEIGRQWAEDRKLNLDTGGLFQQPFNAYTADAQQVIGKHYADEQAGRLTTAQRVQNVANYKNEVERERLLGIDKDKTLSAYETAQAVNHFRDTQGLHTAIGESVLNPDGSRVRATVYDERGALNKFEADPRTYAADPIIGDYYKGLQASTIDEATAGRVGGVHSSSSLTYKGLIPVKRADGTYDVKRDALGRPVIGTTAQELELARASNHNLNMAVGRLRHDYDALRTENPALPQKSDLDLFQQASQKYVSFRQADSEGRNAQPSAAGGKPKYITNANGAGGEGAVPIMDNGQQLGLPSTYVGQAPTKTKASTGETVGYGYDGAQHGQYILRIPGKDDELRVNNREPQNVQYGNHFTALVTPSGKLVRPANGENLTGQALTDFWRHQRELNPKLTVETVINGGPRKGKNELGDREAIATSLGQSYASSMDAITKRKFTQEELLKKADDIIAKQNASYQYVYRGGTKREIDAYAPGAYNGKAKAAEIEQARRAADEATKPRTTLHSQRPAFLKTKSGATRPTPPAKTGGMFN